MLSAIHHCLLSGKHSLHSSLTSALEHLLNAFMLINLNEVRSQTMLVFQEAFAIWATSIAGYSY
jgi:hypothetical protein